MNIIIFFNGWGMDEKILKKLENKTNYEVLNISFPYKIDKVKLENYKRKIFVGWSFGVYYMCEFLNKNKDISYEDVIAINGTPEIIGKNGIPEKVYNLTLKHMNEENLEKFYINMDYKFMTKSKKIDELIYELQYLKDNYSPQENKVSKAIISINDKIIKSKNQNKYYESKDVEIKKVDGGHYIFSQLKSWEDILR
ncbi:pimeloyl-ACP methyl esterase BioG family protein [Fusobacterium sp. IOR10]|uniref:pimeloyl-ACP methyl esterase BioG family protein n=1 Tax=Fusobacterium sp. IOR10 TaxID=2665157 RepID=UPI0013D46D2E|nr:pimeloyl-ACP methyl esterase BioG family protein [Fusobacterium sp. IOR10]